MVEGIVLQQALHGYSDGHRLIASSIDFPQGLARDVRIISDLSGQTLRPGFETYMTGYPLSEVNYYAVARTWYAHEMKRPGSVWTHTLFISFTDLARIANLSQLDNYFIKPQDNTNSYSQPISLLADNDAQKPITSSPYIAAIISLLYAEPNLPVYVPTATRELFETFVLALWSQQWPRLRRSFSFCTGALAPRTFRGEPLSLQLLPDTFRLAQEGRRIGLELREQNGVLPFWIKATIDDLPDTTSSLRKFLWQYGADVRFSRNVFRDLVEAYYNAQTKPWSLRKVEELVAEIAISFPEPDDALSLKNDLFGKRSLNSSNINEETSILSALSTTSHDTSFSKLSPQLIQRSRELALMSPLSAEQLLVECGRNTTNSLFGEVIQGIGAVLPASATSHLAYDVPSLFLDVIKSNPNLAETPAVWRTVIGIGPSLSTPLLSRLQTIDVNVDKLVYAAIEAGVQGLAHDIYRIWGHQVAKAAIEWLATNEGLTLSQQWTQILHDEHQLVTSWLSENPKNAIRLATTFFSWVNPSELSTQPAFNPLDWTTCYKEGNTSLSDWKGQLAATFLLACGLSSNHGDAWQLIDQTFVPVHQAQYTGRLEISAWNILEPILPPDKYNKPWDRCERLREALIVTYAKNSWPIAKLERVIDNQTVWKYVLKTYRGMRKNTSLPKPKRQILDQLTKKTLRVFPWF